MKMDKEQKKKAINILISLIKKHDSLRQFAFCFGEDSSDVSRWKSGRAKISLRAVIKICLAYPEVRAHDLRPDLIPHNVDLIFNKE